MTTSNADENEEQQELSLIAGGSAKWYDHFGRQSGSSYKTKCTLTIRSGSCATWYLSKGDKNVCPHKICTWMFMAALFITAQIWKQPRGPSVGEWVNNLLCPDNGILFSTKKKWRELKCILLNERSQLENVYCMIATI